MSANVGTAIHIVSSRLFEHPISCASFRRLLASVSRTASQLPSCNAQFTGRPQAAASGPHCRRCRYGIEPTCAGVPKRNCRCVRLDCVRLYVGSRACSPLFNFILLLSLARVNVTIERGLTKIGRKRVMLLSGEKSDMSGSPGA